MITNPIMRHINLQDHSLGVWNNAYSIIHCNIGVTTSTFGIFWSRFRDPGEGHQSDDCKLYGTLIFKIFPWEYEEFMCHIIGFIIIGLMSSSRAPEWALKHPVNTCIWFFSFKKILNLHHIILPAKQTWKLVFAWYELLSSDWFTSSRSQNRFHNIPEDFVDDSLLQW